MDPVSQAPVSSLAELTAAHFQPLLRQEFTLHLPEGGTLALLLDQVMERREPRPGARKPFSVMFRCPGLPRERYLLQNCYGIEHPRLGRLDLLITPVQPDDAGMRYEAVFG